MQEKAHARRQESAACERVYVLMHLHLVMLVWNTGRFHDVKAYSATIRDA